MRAPLRVHHILLPLAVAGLIIGLGLLGAAAGVQHLAYDTLLRLRPPAAQRADILLVDVDDEAVALAGSWPWARSLLADGLVTLREMNAREVLVQLPLARRSAPGVDPSALRQELPDALSREFTQIEENVQSLFDAIRRGSVRPQDASRYVTDLVGLVAMAKVRLSNAATGIERDDDALLGQAAGFFGATFVPLDLSAEPVSAGQAASADVLGRLSIGMTTQDDPSLRAPGVVPPVTPAAMGARGGGFSGVLPNADTVRREVPVMASADGRHYAQIGLAALLDYLGGPAVEIRPGTLVLRGAARPGAARGDIVIPLGENANLLLDWPRDGFRRLSWAQILRYGNLEAGLVTALRDLDARGYLSYLRSDAPLLGVYEQAARLRRDMLAAGTAAYVDEWRSARDQFFALCDQFLGGDAEARILADADRATASLALSEEERRAVRAAQQDVPGLFAAARSSFASLRQARDSLRLAMQGTFAIVSPAGTIEPASLGRTPFGQPASAGDVSAAVAATILGGRFLRPLPDVLSPLLAAFFALALGVLAFRMKPLPVFLSGLALSVVSALITAGLFLLGGDFLDPVLPSATAALGGLVLSVSAEASLRRRGHSLRVAFAGRISPEGFKSLAVAPGVLAKPGKTRELAVLSAAIRGMAAGTKHADPAVTARILRAYHGGLGEAILTQNGLMVGASGDSLGALFGALDEGEDRAARACRAALRMKAIESELSGGAAVPLAVRIGIDAGPCVVGDLGVRDGAGWSAAGPATDLASRLESLNHRYGTAVLVSGAVRDAVAGGFLLRTLDTLRVAGTGASVRVFELLAEKESADAALVEMLGIYEEGRERYERREWTRALSLFNRALALRSSDGPSALFADRCRQLIADPARPISSPPC